MRHFLPLFYYFMINTALVAPRPAQSGSGRAPRRLVLGAAPPCASAARTAPRASWQLASACISRAPMRLANQRGRLPPPCQPVALRVLLLLRRLRACPRGLELYQKPHKNPLSAIPLPLARSVFSYKIQNSKFFSGTCIET